MFKNFQGKPLYIGKAANLKSRLLSYLKSEDSRIQKMIELSNAIIYMATNSDIEALILESQKIKKERPPFNIMLRDDKQYFFVAFTKERFPRLYLTHQSKTKKIKKEIDELIGPFTDGTALKATLRILRRFFPYCTCKQLHYVRCLNAHIGKCPGFCCLRNPQKTDEMLYKKNIKAIKDILNGKRDSVTAKMGKEMDRLAHDGRFEPAIELRNKIEQMKRIFENAQIISRQRENEPTGLADLQRTLKLLVPPGRIEGYDISNIQGTNGTGSMVVFTDGLPDKNEYRKFKIKTKHTADDTGMLKEVISRRLAHKEWSHPDLIIVDGGKGQLNAIKTILDKFSITVPVIGLTKNDHHFGDHIFIGRKLPISLSKLPTKAKNLILAVDAEAHRFAINYYRKLHGHSLRFRA